MEGSARGREGNEREGRVREDNLEAITSSIFFLSSERLSLSSMQSSDRVHTHHMTPVGEVLIRRSVVHSAVHARMLCRTPAEHPRAYALQGGALTPNGYTSTFISHYAIFMENSSIEKLIIIIADDDMIALNGECLTRTSFISSQSSIATYTINSGVKSYSSFDQLQVCDRSTTCLHDSERE